MFSKKNKQKNQKRPKKILEWLRKHKNSLQALAAVVTILTGSSKIMIELIPRFGSKIPQAPSRTSYAVQVYPSSGEMHTEVPLNTKGQKLATFADIECGKQIIIADATGSYSPTTFQNKADWQHLADFIIKEGEPYIVLEKQLAGSFFRKYPWLQLQSGTNVAWFAWGNTAFATYLYKTNTPNPPQKLP